MAKNTYLERQRMAQQTYLDIGEEMGIQKMWDFLQLALRDPDLVGKDVWGHGRIKKLFAKLSELASEYKIAFTDHKEADVMQERLDAHLREVWGDELQTFYERYPYMKQFNYTKPPKSWKD